MIAEGKDFGGDSRGLGGVVKRGPGCATWASRESGVGWPSGPPSPRLAPGGFYALEGGTWLVDRQGAGGEDEAFATGSRSPGNGGSNAEGNGLIVEARAAGWPIDREVGFRPSPFPSLHSEPPLMHRLMILAAIVTSLFFATTASAARSQAANAQVKAPRKGPIAKLIELERRKNEWLRQRFAR